MTGSPEGLPLISCFVLVVRDRRELLAGLARFGELVSAERIRQIEAKAIQKMKTGLIIDYGKSALEPSESVRQAAADLRK